MTKRVRRRTLNDKGVNGLKRKAERYIVADPEQRGLFIRVMPPGRPHSYVAVTRNRFGRQIWTTLGTHDAMSIDEAREKTRSVVRRIRDGLPALEPPKVLPESVERTCEQWLERVVRKSGYRTADQKTRIIANYIVPYFKGRNFVDLRRSDVSALLDHVEDNHGAHQADSVLSTLRAVSNWVAKRNDDYTPPFTKGMARTSKGQRERDRVLTDDEIRRVWSAAGDAGIFGALAKLLLLTAQRRQAVLDMKWSDIDQNGVWAIPSEARAKGTGGTLKLPAAALAVLDGIPRLLGADHVFIPSMNIDRPKAKLDEAAGVTRWVLHDLRRTARSLLSRAQVQPHIAERVLGHTAGGVEAIYDRHTFLDEKAEALQRLSDLVSNSLKGPNDTKNVVTLVAS
jgi:integrase